MAAAPFDVLTTTASELKILLASGKVTSAQLIEVYLAENERNNGYLKAVICTAPKNSLIEKANALDRERSSGRTRSHLHGLPMLVKVGFTLTSCFVWRSHSAKDNMDTHPDLGMDTTAGSFALAGARPKKSAEVVGRVMSPSSTLVVAH